MRSTDNISREHLTDLELIALVRSNDDTLAFRCLFDRYWEPLVHIGYQKLGSAQDAADLVQEVFVQLWEKRETLTITINLKAYLFTALRNLIFNYLKHQDVRFKYHRALNNMPVVTPVEEEYSFKELQARFTGQVGLLPEKMREIFILSRDHQLSTKEIATRLSISEQTVRNQISDALRRLRVALGIRSKKNSPTR